MSYRVAVHNAFEGLDDENEDPKRRAPKPKMVVEEKTPDGPKTVKAKPEAPTVAASTTAPASTVAKKPADGQKKKPAAHQNPAPRRDGTTGAPRQEAGDNGARRNTKEFQKDKSHERNDRPPREEGAPRRGRQFDRRSGTGRPPTENKKGGSGAGNWGNETQESIVAAEAKAAGDTESPAVEREAEVTSPEAKKEEPKEPEGISLDEYLAKKAASAPKTDGLKIRSAGEGVDNKAWNSYVALEKQADTPARKAAKEAKDAKETKEKDLAADLLNFRIARDDGDRPEGGRGGRGGRGRGGLSRGSRGRGGGRGDYRGGRGNGPVPSFDMKADFPTLGGAPAAKPQ